VSAAMATRQLPAPGVDAADFKAAMRRLASGVAVVTSRHGGVANGMTATAVCSVSAEPPLVLVVVNRESASHGVITRGECFALNFLAEDQAPLASYFAGGSGKTFDGVAARPGVTGCALIAGGAAELECVVESAYDQGTHTIFVGRVVNAAAGGGRPLVYSEGSFCTVREL
jgi:flavin reductase (DIM6/NTAB) family NADH-FMN oxidoreductase RutF